MVGGDGERHAEGAPEDGTGDGDTVQSGGQGYGALAPKMGAEVVPSPEGFDVP